MGVSSVCVCGGRQSVMSFRSGLRNIVSKVGVSERMLIMCAVTSLVVVKGEER